MDAWFARALAVEAADRFQTGTELYQSLEAALRGETWIRAAGEISGVRERLERERGAARKNAWSVAWQAAATLLKRFTGPRERESAPPLEQPSAPASPPIAAAAETAPVWLDEEALEDAVPSEREPPVEVALPPSTAAAPSEIPKSKRRPKSKAKRKRKHKRKQRTKARRQA
jgi:hypothetical protein